MAKRPDYFKHSRDLLAADFERHPVWTSAYLTDIGEPWYDEHAADEATYRPYLGDLPVDAATASSWRTKIAAIVTFADGSQIPACCHPPGRSSDRRNLTVRDVHPQLHIGSDSAVMLWRTLFPSDDERRHFYDALGRRPDQVFPATLRPRPGILATPFEAVLHGFGSAVPGNLRASRIEP